mmetsp:Transcript_14196/g.21438  ORF Transcript_14196/g.21438 Transcript_14196/m.21438 type:complete len:316 (+) Transcript_14196:1-948(+)
MSWIEKQHPYPHGKTDQRIKQQRRSYVTRFIELFANKVNEMSASYMQCHRDMLSKLLTKDEHDTAVKILPAFWNCIHDLVAAQRSFSIVFRSFGTDLEDVENAFNAFCKRYGYDGSRSDAPNLLLRSSHIGVINCDVDNGKSVIFGVKKRNPIDREKQTKNMELKDFYKLDRMKWYQEQQAHGDENGIRILSHEPKVYEYLKQQSLQQKTMMLSDDYVWWAMHGQQSNGGKMCILNDEDTDIHQIFFDDNLKFDKSEIVDVRKLNIKDGTECVSDTQWHELQRKHLLKVEPLHVILNDDYFTQSIAKLEDAFLAK